jgi:hypothetical protein
LMRFFWCPWPCDFYNVIRRFISGRCDCRNWRCRASSGRSSSLWLLQCSYKCFYYLYLVLQVICKCCSGNDSLQKVL